jgi:hypothetical protein
MSGIDDLNRTELVEMCRAAGLGSVGRTQDHEQIYAVLEGTADPSEIECPLEGKRKMMQQHIEKNWRRLRTQLPGCTGKCVSYGCPNIIVQRCWKGFDGDIL